MAEPVAVAAEPLVEARGLNLKVAGKALLEGADLSLQRGEFVLLVGPSGVGKSVLLKVLTGLIRVGEEPYEISGGLTVAGQDILKDRSREAFRRTGLVFQNHALFDELDVRGNLAFACDHSASPRAPEAMAEALGFLEDAGIAPHREIRDLSGGQRQRVAIARTFSADPELVVYDEPTSALDPRSSRDVAELIKKASERFHKAALVVSHDYEPFEGLVSRVIFFDAQARTLREIAFEDLEQVMAEARVDDARGQAVEPRRLINRAVRGLGRFLEGTTELAAGVASGAPYIWPWGAKARWFGRSCWHYARLCFVGSAIPYMMIAGTIVGFVVTYFTFKRLPHGEHFQDEILPALGAALYRVVIPVLTTLLVAGRTGAALASDLGNRKLSHQVDAMRTFGVSERPYLLTAILWMNALGMFVLDLVGFFAASVTSLVVFTLTQSANTPFFWSSYFFLKLTPEEGDWLPPDSGFVIAKLLCASLVTAAVSFGVGASPKRSGRDVAFATTTTVYWGTVGVLLVHFAFAFFEFNKPGL